MTALEVSDYPLVAVPSGKIGWPVAGGNAAPFGPFYVADWPGLDWYLTTGAAAGAVALDFEWYAGDGNGPVGMSPVGMTSAGDAMLARESFHLPATVTQPGPVVAAGQGAGFVQAKGSWVRVVLWKLNATATAGGPFLLVPSNRRGESTCYGLAGSAPGGTQPTNIFEINGVTPGVPASGAQTLQPQRYYFGRATLSGSLVGPGWIIVYATDYELTNKQKIATVNNNGATPYSFGFEVSVPPRLLTMDLLNSNAGAANTWYYASLAPLVVP